MGLKALGVDVYGVDSAMAAKEIIYQIYNKNDYAVIFITEDWMTAVREDISKLKNQALPAIVAIPSQQGPTGAGVAGLKKIVEQAVGSDILNIK